MRDLCHHTANRGRVDARHDLVEPLETKTFDNQLMLLRRPDRTPVVSNPDTGVRALGGFCFRCHHLPGTTPTHPMFPTRLPPAAGWGLSPPKATQPTSRAAWQPT